MAATATLAGPGEACEVMLGAGTGGAGARAAVVLLDAAATLGMVGFLARYFVKSWKRLTHSRSTVMLMYYCLILAATGFGAVRLVAECLQAGGVGGNAVETLFVLASFGQLTVQFGVVAFLLQGSELSPLEAALRTVAMAAGLGLVDLFAEVVMSVTTKGTNFAYHGDAPLEAHKATWGFWTGHYTLLTVFYGGVAAVPHTRLRDYLPARPSFFTYVKLMAGLAFGCMVGASVLVAGQRFGFCIFGLFWTAYKLLLCPVLYFTFVADFFFEHSLFFASTVRHEHEEEFYAHLKDAGYYDEQSGLTLPSERDYHAPDLVAEGATPPPPAAAQPP